MIEETFCNARLLLKSILLLLLLTFFSHVAFAAPPNDDFTALEKVIQEELKETKTPGAAIAIVRGDRVIYARGYKS